VKNGNLSYLAVDVMPTVAGKQPTDVIGDIRSQARFSPTGVFTSST
jgi:hypothetical protein